MKNRIVHLWVACCAILLSPLAEGVPVFAPGKLGSIPQISFERNESFEAVSHAFDTNTLIAASDGRSYVGFSFRTPEWLDGPVAWLSVSKQGSDEIWHVYSETGQPVASVEPLIRPAAEFGGMADKFPMAGSVARLAIAMEKLQPGKRYFAVREIGGKSPAPLAIIATVDSVRGRFEFGELHRKLAIPPRDLTAKEVMAALGELRREKGDVAAVSFLMESMDRCADNTSRFDELFTMIWREAQVGSGRTDQQWASMLNDAAFTSSFRQRYYRNSDMIISNLCTTLGTSGRYGRLSEVLAIWRESLRLAGHRMDPSAYPDLGPGVACLPEIRVRDMPALLSYAGEDARSRPDSFHVNAAGAFLRYANHLSRAGKWREAMEWTVWVRHWATKKGTKDPIAEKATIWFSANETIATFLDNIGYTEDALAVTEESIAAPWGNVYRGRDRITQNIHRLNILRRLKRAPADIFVQYGDLIEQVRKNVHLTDSTRKWAEACMAMAMIDGDRVAEGEAILDRLVGEDYEWARRLRVEHWIETGRSAGVEEELKALLMLLRETGDKQSETWLYALYADFLEKQGRDGEALAMRREALRLCRDFDLFTKLPIELAKLARLLAKLGDAAGSSAAAGEANSLLAGGKLPASRVEEARLILAGITKQTAAKTPESEQAGGIDFQPQRSVVIPLEALPWTTMLTITNTGKRVEKGLLTLEGAPALLSVEGEEGDILARLEKEGEAAGAGIGVSVNPGTYRMVCITSDGATTLQGELKLTWTPEGQGAPVESTVIIEEPESGVAGAVVQAGNYRSNPFYGVPIHLHYVAMDKSVESLPLRFVCSKAARVEVYLLDGTPLAIDGQGNGSLLDRSDQLFAGSDGKGNMLLPLVDGSASFRVVLYPDGPLPEEGINLSVEVFDKGAWSLHSRNSFAP